MRNIFQLPKNIKYSQYACRDKNHEQGSVQLCVECIFQQFNIDNKYDIRSKSKAIQTIFDKEIKIIVAEQAIQIKEIQECLGQFNQMLKIIQSSIRSLQEFSNQIKQQQCNYMCYVYGQIAMLKQDLFDFTNQQIHKVLDHKNKQIHIDSDKIQKNISKVNIFCLNIQSIIRTPQQKIIKIPQIEEQVIPQKVEKQQSVYEQKFSQKMVHLAVNDQISIHLQPFDYEIEYQHQWKEVINSAQVSTDEKFIAIGGDNQKLMIYDIENMIICKTVDLETTIFVCQFSPDSSLLFLGCSDGYLYCFDSLNNFEQSYQSKVHENWIYNIYCISNDLIVTSSEDKSFCLTDIKQNQQLLKIEGTSSILGLEYVKEREIIITSSMDKAITFYSIRDKKKIYQYCGAHKDWIFHIQLINKDTQLLSLCVQGALKFWIIDYDKLDMNCYKEISDNNHIYDFFSVLNDQQLIIVCTDCIKVLNQEDQIIGLKTHNIPKFLCICFIIISSLPRSSLIKDNELYHNQRLVQSNGSKEEQIMTK